MFCDDAFRRTSVSAHALVHCVLRTQNIWLTLIISFSCIALTCVRCSGKFAFFLAFTSFWLPHLNLFTIIDPHLWVGRYALFLSFALFRCMLLFSSHYIAAAHIFMYERRKKENNIAFSRCISPCNEQSIVLLINNLINIRTPLFYFNKRKSLDITFRLCFLDIISCWCYTTDFVGNNNKQIPFSCSVSLKWIFVYSDS